MPLLIVTASTQLHNFGGVRARCRRAHRRDSECRGRPALQVAAAARDAHWLLNRCRSRTSCSSQPRPFLFSDTFQVSGSRRRRKRASEAAERAADDAVAGLQLTSGEHKQTEEMFAKRTEERESVRVWQNIFRLICRFASGNKLIRQLGHHVSIYICINFKICQCLYPDLCLKPCLYFYE